MKRILITLIFFVSVSANGEDVPIRIGVSLGLTGKYASPALMQQRGYRLWERDINASGGILGRNVVVYIRDDNSDPDRAAQIYRSFIEQEKVDFVIGPYSASLTMAVMPVVEKYGYPMLAPGSASDTLWQQEFKNIFGVRAPASRYSMGFLNLLVMSQIDNIAIFHADDIFSESAAKGTVLWATRLALNVVVTQKFVKEQADGEYNRLAEQAKEAGADVVIMAGHFNESVKMRRALDNIEWSPKIYYATVGPVFDRYRDTLQGREEHVFAPSPWEASDVLDYPGAERFIRIFRREYRIDPTYHAASAYAAGEILERAIIDSGTLSRSDIRQALRNLDMYNVIGRYTVDRSGEIVKRMPLTIQWQNGRREIVWPPEYQTAEAIF